MAGVAGSQPQDLAPPVPGAGTPPPQAAPMPKAVPPPAVTPTPAPSPVGSPAPQDPLEALANQHAQSQDGGPDPLESLADLHPKEETSDEPASFMNRVKAGFASNDDEKQDYLKQLYGESGVRKIPDGFMVKEDGKWKKFNNDWLGMGDPANLGRQAVVEAGALPAEAMGTAAAAGEELASAGFATPAAVGTMAAGRVVGGGMGESLAQTVAHNVIGIPDKQGLVGDIAQAGLQGGMRALFGRLADWGMKLGVDKFTKPAQDVASKAVDEMSAPLRARTEQALANLTSWQQRAPLLPEKGALAGVQDALELKSAADRAGIDLRPDELFPNNPKMQEIAKRSMASPKMQEFVMNRGAQASRAIEAIGDSFPQEGTAGEAIQNASVLDRAWGKLIGKFRDQAIKNSESPTRELFLPKDDYQTQIQLSNLPQWGQAEQSQFGQLNDPIHGFRNQALLMGNQEQAMNDVSKFEISNFGKQGEFEPGKKIQINMSNLAQTLQDLRNDFGFNAYAKPTASAIEDLAQQKGLEAKPGKTEFIVQQIDKLTHQIVNNDGKMDQASVDQFYNVFKRLADTHYASSGGRSQDFQAFMKIKNAFRDDFGNGISTLLGSDDRAAYQTAMSRFSDIKTASDGVKKILETDSPTTSAVVDYLRTGGIGNAERIANLKTIIEPENPDQWQAIGKAYFDRMLADHRLEGAEGQRLGEVNWTKLQKTLDPDRKQFSQLTAVLGEDRAAKLTDITDAMAAVQRGDMDFKAQSTWIVRVAKAAATGLRGDLPGVAEAFASNNAAMKLLSTDRADKIIGRLALKDRSAFNQVMGDAMQLIQSRIPGVAAQQGTRAIMNGMQTQSPQQ